jgi:site-specific DNA-cytosine methylase
MNPDALTFASVCSGIESASVAWEPLGMRPIWFSEIMPFPSKVLKHHWPHVHNWGDFTKIPARAMRGSADILVGGTPCQAFSVAGKRESLADDRGNLTLEFCRLADELDPHLVVWENVPGVLTTSDNAFGCFLAKLCGSDAPAVPCDPPTAQEINLNAKTPTVLGHKSSMWRWDKSQSAFVPKWPAFGAAIGPDRRVAWRVLDAQYFGLAQRRRRVFVVASARDNIDPTKILFEYESVRRDTPPSREAGQNPTRGAHGGTDSHGESVGTLMARTRCGMSVQDAAQGHILPIHDKATRHACVTGKGSGNGLGVGRPSDPMFTLTTGDHHAVCVGTLDTECGYQSQAFQSVAAGHVIGTITARMFNALGARDVEEGALRIYNSRARKLMPVECERLQGFPDGHTDIESDTPDGPRYSAIGNSKAVTAVQWIGRRIIKHLKGEI